MIKVFKCEVGNYDGEFVCVLAFCFGDVFGLFFEFVFNLCVEWACVGWCVLALVSIFFVHFVLIK